MNCVAPNPDVKTPSALDEAFEAAGDTDPLANLEDWLHELDLDALLPLLQREDIYSPRDLFDCTDDDLTIFLTGTSLTLGKKGIFRRNVGLLREHLA
jgi:hypothetical protein